MKKPVKKAVAKKKSGPKWVRHTCQHSGCKKLSAYMQRDQKTGKMGHWCPPHFDSDIMIPQKKRDRATVKKGKAISEKHIAKSVAKSAKSKVKVKVKK